MKEIVDRLIESHRELREDTLRGALDSMCSTLKSKLNNPHMTIRSDYSSKAVELVDEESGDTYYIYPDSYKNPKAEESAKTTLDVGKNFPGATYRDGCFYDTEGNKLGRALVRRPYEYHRREYNPDKYKVTKEVM